MHRFKLSAFTTISIASAGAFLSATPAYAAFPVIDPASIAEEIKQLAQETGILNVIQAVQSIDKGISSAIGTTTYGSTNTLLQEGFTQEANYSKASVGAMENITDASNEAMAQYQLQLRDAQIRDEQTASPSACTALDNGVSTQAAAIQGSEVGFTLQQNHAVRGEGGPQSPSYYGQAQGVAAMGAEHLNNYCDQNDVAAGLCKTVAPTADADQRFSSLFGSGSYANQTAVAAANDYELNLVYPVVPTSPRGDQLSSIAGQEAALQRRSYEARMNMAQSVIDDIIGKQSPSVPLTSQQQAFMTEIGLPQATTGSWLLTLQIAAELPYSDINWNAQLQSMPPPAVEREIALELAVNNYLQFQIYQNELRNTAIDATNLAQTAEHNYQPTLSMPSPNIN
jgi:hypothetical protein